MGHAQTADEYRIQLIHEMGEEVGTLYYHLRNRLVDCYALWLDYKALYFEKKERVDLLNDISPRFFGKIQKIILDKVILDLCKLTDPPSARNGKANISFEQLIKLVKQPFKDQLKVIKENLANNIGILKYHRNKRIGHNDLDTAESIRRKELLRVEYSTIEEVFGCFFQLFNEVQYHYIGSKTAFNLLDEKASVEILLGTLYDGLESQKKRSERFKKGTHTDEDIHRRKLNL